MITSDTASESKRIHFMGIGGAGVSAVAAFAKNAGFEVSGCDTDPTSLFLNSLKKEQVEIFDHHDPSHLKGVDILVVSPAIESLDPNNVELVHAKKVGIQVEIGEKFLADYILPGKKVIAISGVHGKSTTTAMIGKILEDAFFDPSVLVGAVVSDWDKNYRLGKGDYFVLEADEYQEKFLLYHPFISVITSIEMDHPEFFKNLREVTEAFRKFAENTVEGGYIVTGKDVFEIKDLSVRSSRLGKDFEKQNLNLKLIGEFNQENAALAFEVAKILRIDEFKAKTALESFLGIGRRFEFRGEEKGVKVFDDYAHHPTAIKLTAEAARLKFPNSKIWLVYQPHMYSRTKYLEKEFVETFKTIPVDETILVDIFAARQENQEHISSEDIVKQVKKETVRYIGNFENTSYYLVKNLSANDIVIVMGAGDIYKLSVMVLAKLRNTK